MAVRFCIEPHLVNEMPLPANKNQADAPDSSETQKTTNDLDDSQKDLELAEREQQLPSDIEEKRRKGLLKAGFTTGTSATAATKAALLALLHHRTADDVYVSLPKGGNKKIRISWTKAEKHWRSVTAAVVKDAGDDPDVTHRAEICSTVSFTDDAGIIVIDGGIGVGRVTKPGLGLTLGRAAINPTPTRMIEQAVEEVASNSLKDHGVNVVISVPSGEEIAKKTDNPRLGIVGGISILGTTGIVLPYSTASFAASIRQALDVALALGNEWVVLTTGGRSEEFAKVLLGTRLPDHCFVQIGDFAGYSIRQCELKKIKKATIAGFIGKLTKMSMGVKQTHVRGSHVDMKFMAEVALECLPTISPSLLEEIEKANTARHVAEIIVANKIGGGFFRLICKKVYEHMWEYSKGNLELEVIMFDFDGRVYGQWPPTPQY
jgi:cobalt-precorrin-5B (C1)-methyltransferase